MAISDVISSIPARLACSRSIWSQKGCRATCAPTVMAQSSVIIWICPYFMYHSVCCLLNVAPVLKAGFSISSIIISSPMWLHQTTNSAIRWMPVRENSVLPTGVLQFAWHLEHSARISLHFVVYERIPILKGISAAVSRATSRLAVGSVMSNSDVLDP